MRYRGKSIVGRDGVAANLRKYPFKDQPNKAKGETKIPNPNVASYKEWDINPYKYGQNRGTERIVTGSDGSAWYTPDHYKTWYQIR